MLHCAAVDWAGLDGRPFHAGQADVDTVDGLAGDLQRDIEILLLGAHQCPFRGRLDADLLRIGMRHLSSKRSHLAIPSRAPRRAVGNHAISRTQLFDRYAPGFGSREQQSLARFRAGKLKIIAAVLDRRRGVGPHAPIKAVRDTLGAGPASLPELWFAAAKWVRSALAHDLKRPFRRHFAAVAIGGSVLRGDLAPVALQLLGNHHGIGGPYPLAEFGLGNPYRHSIVGRDDNPGVDLLYVRLSGAG